MDYDPTTGGDPPPSVLKAASRLAIGDALPKNSSQHPGRVQAPGMWKFRLRDSTRIHFVRSTSINKDVGAQARAREFDSHRSYCRRGGPGWYPLHISY